MFDIYTNILLVCDELNVSMDQDGNFTPLPTQQREHSMCKIVANGSGQLISLEGGDEYVYSYVVFLPIGAAGLKLGTQVKILDANDDSLLAKGRVKSFVSSPFGAKIYI